MDRHSWIRQIGDYQLVMVIGYVSEGMVSMFIRDKDLKHLCDFGIMSRQDANWLWERLQLKENNNE